MYRTFLFTINFLHADLMIGSSYKLIGERDNNNSDLSRTSVWEHVQNATGRRVYLDRTWQERDPWLHIPEVCMVN